MPSARESLASVRTPRVGVVAIAAVVVLAGFAFAHAGRGSGSAKPCVAWTSVPSPRLGGPHGWNVLNAVAARSPNDVWAVGWHESEEQYSSDHLTYAQHWNGAAWTIVPTPNPPPRVQGAPRQGYLQDVTVVGKSEAWAVGYYEKGDILEEAFTEHWDGNAWTLVPVPDLGEQSLLHAVAAVSPSDVWAVGFANGKALTLHWDGSRWAVVRVPIPGAYRSSLYAIDARAANDVWAAGYRSGKRGRRPLIEHWNGRRWRVLRLRPRRVPNGTFHAVHAVSRRNVWVVGTTQVEIDLHTLTGHWNGRSWSFGSTPNRRYNFNELWAVGGLRGGEAWAGGGWSEAGEFHQLLIQHRIGGRWRTTRLEGVKAGWLTDIELLGRQDGWAVGAGFFYSRDSSGYRPLTQRLRRC
jgi:hypothetical protein